MWRSKPLRATNSLERALGVLELVAANPGGVTLSRIARRLNFPHSTCHYILTRLHCHGYLSREREGKRYEIGTRLIAIAHGALRDLRLRVAAEPILHRLAAETRLSAFIGVLEGRAVMIVGKVEQPGLLPMDMEIGVRYPAHRTALGKAILGHRTKRELLNLYRGPTPPRLRAGMNFTELLKGLSQVRRQGHATNDEELFMGFRALAAPIMNPEGRVEAAVSATGTLLPLTDPAIVSAVRRAAVEIAKRMSRSQVRHEEFSNRF